MVDLFDLVLDLVRLVRMVDLLDLVRLVRMVDLLDLVRVDLFDLVPRRWSPPASQIRIDADEPRSDRHKTR